MRLITSLKHPSVTDVQSSKVYKRKAARAIVIDRQDILLLYTARYNDYSLPGGGIDDHEDITTGLKRELEEETGAQNIKILKEYGIIEELRPHYLPDYDHMHMTSYFYVCQAQRQLGPSKMEHYEIKNGMKALWINIKEALEHNKSVIAKKERSMGLSIERETFMLDLIQKELIV